MMHRSGDKWKTQIGKFVENILDVDRVGRDVQKNVRANYVFDQPREAKLFYFKPIPVSFGPVDEDTCGTILYPNTIRDLIDFSLRDCVEKNIPLRRCRNCGRYFPVIGRITAEYCSRPQPSGKLCRNIAPVQKWAKNSKKDLVFSEYRREYKRHFSWIKVGKILRISQQYGEYTCSRVVDHIGRTARRIRNGSSTAYKNMRPVSIAGPHIFICSAYKLKVYQATKKFV